MLIKDMFLCLGSSCGDSSRINCGVISSGGSEVSESSVTDYIVSPGSMKYYLPSYVGNISVTFENQVFDSLNKGYCFYKEYVRLSGFGVRKTTKKKGVYRTITLKHFICSCEGFNDPYEEKKALKKRCTISQRCGYKAKMILKYMGDNKYFIKTFVELHNHPLASETSLQFLKANREMNISLRTICFDASKVNIGVSKSFYFAKEMTGGYGNVGANLRDFRNFSRDVKSFVGERDDKHDKCVTFAACLLSHENIEDYTWALDHFVKAMGRNSIVILTYQCPTMKVAIHNSFSDKNGLIASKHHLCMWHIMQKFPIKLGNRLCKETDFMEKMKTCIWSSILETDEFERG
ncbi:protein FAR1-RELATED SEQUENCE 4-like [Apium graveolens]|uniref:protein FAR1-RELATED SEQUENCE 4-like n=1 Tax=Apium graveolens TaxID=4045 RepID=UPI003D7A4F8F